MIDSELIPFLSVAIERKTGALARKNLKDVKKNVKK